MIVRPKLHLVYSTLGHRFHVTTDGSPKPDLPSGEGETLRVACPQCQPKKDKTLVMFTLEDAEATRVSECTVCGWWAYTTVDRSYE